MKALSRLKGLLEIVSLDMTTKSVGAGRYSELEGESSRFLGAATLKLPSKVQTNVTESRLVFDNVRE